jgi:hypothetical protein
MILFNNNKEKKEMRLKLITPLLLNILVHHSVHAATPIFATPENWAIGENPNGGDNYIPDTSTSSHVTGIELGLTTTGAIYTVNIIGNGYTGSAIPNAGCSDLSGTTTLTVGANERVTVVEAWRNSDTKWYRIRLTLNTLDQLEYNSTHGGTDTLYTFTIPAGQEFTGLGIYGATNGCTVTRLAAISRAAVCSISIDLSLIDG